MTLTKEKLCALLKEQGLAPRAYSGRAMWGTYCVGVAVHRVSDYTYPPGWCQDSLGKNFIVYWPRVEVSEDTGFL